MIEVNVDISAALSKLDKSEDALVVADAELFNSVKNITEPMAKSLCPVDTGFLRDSINTQREGFGVVAIGTPVYYGAFQEFGFYISKEFAMHASWGRGMPELEGQFMRRPFLIPAVEGTLFDIISNIQAKVNASLK